MSVPSMDSTYGAWLIALFLQVVLFGIGVLQTFLYFQWSPDDDWTIWGSVTAVMFFETIQVVSFFRSTYYRFVQRFGQIQEELIWSDSLQLLANYITGFVVQMYFASRIYRLTRESRVYEGSARGLCIVVVVIPAVVQVGAGITQTIVSYQIRSYLKLDQTKAITTLQTAASLACDVAITGYLCAFLRTNKQGLPRTNKVLNKLMMNAMIRGMLTAISSAFTMILFLAYPDTFWFFLSFTPNSKLYMNSMLATLNLRQHMRNQILGNDWNTLDLGQVPDSRGGQVSAVEFVIPPDNSLEGTMAECENPSTDSVTTHVARKKSPPD
ncbi:hypothetical protein DFH08DRAFT_950988 [Mycena albidolilacea]|uniref:DUF6534 domain-containing protein n=1 Tax=Mycena albidolilacea TaxID=1033008 RepID=A0AAD7ANF2_9AGAR|nr:hypothetical protein DFH08DRAFT_950988 [Mycena albidolilacea]